MQKIIIILLLVLTTNKAYSQSPYWESEFQFESSNSLANYESLKSFNLNSQQLNKRSNYLYQLDSSYFFNGTIEPTNKVTFIAEENRDIFLSYDFIDNQNTDPKSYSAYTFENGLFTKQTYNLWDGNLEALNESDPQNIRYYKYNDQDLLIEKRSLGKNDITFGGKGNLTIYTYDENKLPTRSSHYFWRYETNSYELTREVIYRNNEKKLLNEIVTLRYREESGWTQDDSTVYIYNNLDQIITEDFFEKGPRLDTFYYAGQNIYHYNTNGSIHKIDEFNSPTGLMPNDWYQQLLRSYNYYSYGSIRSINLFDVTDPYYQYYDLQQYESQRWKYNEEVAIEDVKLPRKIFRDILDDYGYFQNHMVLEESFYRGGNQFEAQYLDYRVKNFYSELETSTSGDLQSDDPITIYPNPASDFLKIDLPFTAGNIDLTLTDITGKVVKSQSFQNGQDISIADLDVGLYFYTITYNGSQKTGKLIIER